MSYYDNTTRLKTSYIPDVLLHNDEFNQKNTRVLNTVNFSNEVQRIKNEKLKVQNHVRLEKKKCRHNNLENEENDKIKQERILNKMNHCITSKTRLDTSKKQGAVSNLFDLEKKSIKVSRLKSNDNFEMKSADSNQIHINNTKNVTQYKTVIEPLQNRNLHNYLNQKNNTHNALYSNSTTQNHRPSLTLNDSQSENSNFFPESPIPYLDFKTDIKKPHVAPYKNDFSNESKIKNFILKNNTMNYLNNLSLFSDQDYFQSSMQHRFLRWGPTPSQNNSEALVSGLHPYQRSCYGNEKKTKSKNFDLFNLKNLFNHKKAFDLEDQNKNYFENSLQPIENPEKIGLNLNNIEKLNNENPDLIKTANYLKLLNALNLNTNTSNSFSQIMSNSSNRFNNNKNPILLSKRSIHLHEDSVTPNAIPFNDYDINFEKKSLTNELLDDVVNSRNEIINSLDLEIQNLIDGVDTFLFDCFESTWSWITTLFKMCF